jgi:glycosyltransferase involved in cell wall biosynthesis
MEGYNNRLFKSSENFTKTEHIKSIPVLEGRMDNKPLITIAIPTYKRTSFLKEAIDSALNQNGPNDFRVIVVDNDPQSNCDTSKLISTYSDKRLSYYKNAENLGMFGNLNRCVQLVQTKYIAFLHDDDLLKNNYIETITRYLDPNLDIGCICVPFDQINSPFIPSVKESGHNRLHLSITKFFYKKHLYKIFDSDNYFMHRNVFGPPTCGMLFNRELCLKSGGWNEDYFPSGDWFYMIHFNNKYKVYRIQDILAQYRWDCNTSLDSNVILKFYQQSKEIVDAYKSKYKIFYNEIVRQVANDYEKYGLKFSENEIGNFSKLKMRLLKIYQWYVNLRYLSFN